MRQLDEETYNRMKVAAVGERIPLTIVGSDSLENYQILSESIDKEVIENARDQAKSLARLATSGKTLD